MTLLPAPSHTSTPPYVLARQLIEQAATAIGHDPRKYHLRFVAEYTRIALQSRTDADAMASDIISQLLGMPHRHLPGPGNDAA